MNMQDIGFRISDLRKKRDMTQLELADKMGVSYQAVSSWERGSTMPDISRLPEISQILAVSIDELLGNDTESEIVKDVLTGQTDTYTSYNQPHISHIKEVAPILKPSQMDNLVEKVKPVKLADLSGLAPFISSEILGQLAITAEETGDLDGLNSIAPFLSRDILDQLAYKIETVKGLDALSGLAPFISRPVLKHLALKAQEAGDIDSLASIAPFVDRDTLDQLAIKIETVGGISQLSGIAPFVSRKILGELAIKAVDAGSIHELQGIAPFIDSELLGQLILKATGATTASTNREN